MKITIKIIFLLFLLLDICQFSIHKNNLDRKLEEYEEEPEDEYVEEGEGGDEEEY